MIFARGGVLGLIDRLLRRMSAVTPSLETSGLHKSFGALIVANDIDFRLEAGARHALIGPNGAGKTTFINLITGRARADRRAASCSAATTSRALPQAARVQARPRPHLPDQHAVPRLAVLDNVALAVAERDGVGGACCARSARIAPCIEEAYALLERLGLADDALTPVKRTALRQAAAGRDRHRARPAPKVLLLDEPAAGVPSAETQRSSSR